MILYHGSDRIIKKPQFGIGNPYNDYGLGFYCTEELELAKEWACPEARDGFANVYELSTDGLKMLDLQSSEFHILNWIALLLKNRIFAKKTPLSRTAENYILQEFLPNTEDYDIIYGYRADDSYFSYAKDFLNNALSVKQLEQAMRLGNLGNQTVLMTERAIESLTYVGYEIADATVYYARRRQREDIARATYLEGHDVSLEVIDREMYVLDLIRNGVKNDDERLFRTVRE